MSLLSVIVPAGAFLSASVGYLAIRVLLAIGIGYITYEGVQLTMNEIFTLAQGHYNNIPTFSLQILGLAGGGEALGLITASLLFRVSFVLTSRLGVLPK